MLPVLPSETLITVDPLRGNEVHSVVPPHLSPGLPFLRPGPPEHESEDGHCRTAQCGEVNSVQCPGKDRCHTPPGYLDLALVKENMISGSRFKFEVVGFETRHPKVLSSEIPKL